MLFAVSLILLGWGLNSYVVHFIRLRKFKGHDIYSFRLIEMLMNLTAAAIMLNIALMFNLDMLNDTVRMFLCILISAFSCLLLIMNVLAWIKKQKGKNNLFLIIETLSSIFFAAGVVYWRLFQFWAC